MSQNKPTNMETKIAGDYTVADWEAMNGLLEIGGTPELWKIAFKIFLQTRLEERYFKPIRLLQAHGEKTGEGFAIVALQCSLIEFLASTLQGVNYKHLQNDKCSECKKNGRIATNKLGEYEYSSSMKLFCNFLNAVPPFKNHFKKTANSFYINVRCALFHEARTKGGWRILAGKEDDTVIMKKGQDKIVCRNGLQKCFEKYVACYGKKLQTCGAMQEAFKRKFEGLCRE